MKSIKIFVFLSIFAMFANAQTPFELNGVKSYYPVVELNSDKIDKKYKQILLDMIVQTSTELEINTQNFSTRSLAFLISYIGVGDTIALKIELMLGENATRLDTKDNIFVISYMSSRILVVEDLESDLLETAEELLHNFALQYKDDNL
ncbi:MAG: hypothetical protein OQK48_03845 [Sulfurimonas sp.]|uniref:hypothetical protein n=1 Tax=Sulfurimonas sp. TaxID=2022749 RepID=UPI002638D730|nr:hypothetical protein [Sulfurimonas sp.]MCW8896228.1 hypothetical protein [Sulfurimonas sp.]MCW8954055.1 hypothetical protein [Sulfurimonas sp.]MCW9068327.1 hypothetical protein [Sulfurimonas sp.]